MGLCSRLITTPLGNMFAVADSRGLVLCEFHDRPMLPLQVQRVERICGGTPVEGTNGILDQTQRELNEYFLGQREDFTIPLILDGTPFQSRVWRALRDIPYGATESYGALAARIGDPKAVRAVGLANGANPISIIIPCHRVIGSNGSLTGYGGGLPTKRALLDLEQGQRALL